MIGYILQKQTALKEMNDQNISQLGKENFRLRVLIDDWRKEHAKEVRQLQGEVNVAKKERDEAQEQFERFKVKARDLLDDEA